MSSEDKQFYIDQLEDALSRIGDIVTPLMQELDTLKKEIRKLDKIDSDMAAVKAAIKASTQDTMQLQSDVNLLKSDLFDVKLDMRDARDVRSSHNTSMSFLNTQG